MSSSTFGITTYIQGACPWGQSLARPLTIVIGPSFTATLDEFEPTVLERIALVALAIITLPLAFMVIGAGLILLSLSKDHHEACERLVQDFAISPPELKEQALKVTSALAQHVAIFNQQMRYSSELKEIIEGIKSLYFARSETSTRRDWRFWQSALAELCARYKLPCYDVRQQKLTPFEASSKSTVQKILGATKVPEGDQLRLDIAILLCKIKEIHTVEEVMAEMAFLQPKVFQSLPHVGIVNNPVDCVARSLLGTPRPALTDAIAESLVEGVIAVKEALQSSVDDKDRSLAAVLQSFEEAPENEKLLSQTIASLSDAKAKDRLQGYLNEMRACYLAGYATITNEERSS